MSSLGPSVVKFTVLIFLFSGLLSLGSCAHRPLGNGVEKSCPLVLRAAIDMGSGSSKMQIAQVNSCTQQVQEVVLEGQKKVPYRQELEPCFGSELCLTKGVQEQGWALMSEWAQVIRERGVDEVRGVATEALRQARNGGDFLAQLNREFEWNLKLIDQEQEAQLGFRAAVLGRQNQLGRQLKDLKSLVVWDIGGGSQQISRWEGSENWTFLKSDLGSVALKNQVVKDIQSKDITHSPNPISWDEAELAIEYVRQRASELASSQWRRLFARRSTEVLGVGGVHRFSLPGQLAKHRELDFSEDHYTRDQVFSALQLRHSLTDDQIGGEYFETEITNLILVYGLMSELGIRRVTPVPVDLNLALLSLSPEDWQKIRHISQD